MKKYISKILFLNYFLYQFFLVISDSVISSLPIVSQITSYSIRISFVIVIIIDIYMFFCKEFTKIEILICTIVGALFSILYYFNKDGIYLINILYICAFKRIDYKSIFKVYFIATVSAVFLVSVVGFFTPFTSNRIVNFFSFRRIRFSMGFRNRPTASYYLLSSTVAYFIFAKKSCFFNLLILYLINFLYFLLTLSRGPFITLNLVFLLYIVLNKTNDKIFKNFSFLTALSYVALPLLVYFISYNYNNQNKLILKLNSALSGRVNLLYIAIQKYGLSLFGKSLNMNTNEETYFVVDSAFMQCLFQKGIIIFVFLIVFCLIYIYIIYKFDEKMLMLSMLYVALISSIDVGFFALQFAPFQLCFLYILSNLKRGNE